MKYNYIYIIVNEVVISLLTVLYCVILYCISTAASIATSSITPFPPACSRYYN